MRNSAEIQLIGYVYQDAKFPDKERYPAWVTFSLAVNKKYKDKNNEDKQKTTWFRCRSNSEKLSGIIAKYVKDKMGLLVKGIPESKAFTNKEGKIESNIEVSITDFIILTSPNNLDTKDSYQEKLVNHQNNLSGNNTTSYAINDDEIPF